jgi:hypothetical protein
MEARLYELIRDYQAAHAETLGGRMLEFHADALHRFARVHPDRYPEYILDDGRLANAIALARRDGEIVPPPSGHRDEPLLLRGDHDHAP